MMEIVTTDVLVIGGGAAAIRAACEAAGLGVKVDLVDKGKTGESGSSPTSLGGFSALLDSTDTSEKFFQDWLRVGGYICEQNVVWEAISRSREVVEKTQELGMAFLKNPDGSLSLARRAGHSIPRGLQLARLSGPGRINPVNVIREIAEKRGVRFHENVMVTRLFQEDGCIAGAFGISSHNNSIVFQAGAVVLAAGGANRLYPCVADGIQDTVCRTTGDAFSLAYYIGSPLIDMEFAQFRDSPPLGPIYGGVYLNASGERFMEKYDPKALERAPRYLVASAVYREIIEGRGPVICDAASLGERALGVSDYSKKSGPIEITIQFQRLMGGVHVNDKAETRIKGFFAAGESAGGIHGGDRMQGNAFLETQVFGAAAGKNAAALVNNSKNKLILRAQVIDEEKRIGNIRGNEDPAAFAREVQKIMWENVGVVREKAHLQQALSKFEEIKERHLPRLSDKDIFGALEAANLLLTSEMVTRAALAREETRCTHNRLDFPATSKDWLKHVCITVQSGGGMTVSTIPITLR
jgi:succinate dehydrogenase/fumarate reductase flavoprotein subunit